MTTLAEALDQSYRGILGGADLATAHLGDQTKQWAEPVEVRRNLIRSPRGSADRAGNWQAAATRSTELVGGPAHCAQWGKGVIISPTSSATYWSARTGTGATPVVGAFEAGYSVFSSRGGSNGCGVYFYDSTGALLENRPTIFPQVPHTAGEWLSRSAWVATPPAGTAYVLLEILNIGAFVAGDIIGFTATYISNMPGPYFDGNTSPDPDMIAEWAGPRNASESILWGWPE